MNSSRIEYRIEFGMKKATTAIVENLLKGSAK